ncbi:hypothetical protein AJ80_10036 [Polytolypa hystricis UAMH7299]|uniref:Aminoglycoside phosphotransferase domain-containing protein n=1 Tax=Polytolypa hystricis (strain UAMH7299) TaxID=1447883 RepID=A0A2B7WEN3_POLH7|nr:hypothetical protein AJ80_10036 [Polytolypa hystricis UAMH7299]
MSARFPNWTVGVSFVLGASVSLFVSLLALRSRELRLLTATPYQSESKPGSEETASRNNKTDGDDDGDIRKALVALNESAMTDLQRELQNTALWADLSTLFTRWGHLYPSRRRRLLQTRSLRSQECRGNSAQKQLHFEDLLSVPQGQPEILQPLAPEVTALLQQYSYPGSKLTGHDICSALSSALKSGKVLWSHFARAVVQLDEQIVVKLGPNISLIDANMTAHILKHSAEIPVPQPLGVLSLGGKVYAFMSLIEGRSLEQLWPGLSSTDKCSVQDQLDAILENLRLLPLPSKYLGGGNPPQCIDCRVWKRKSPESMESEVQFNKFLLSGNSRPSMEPYVEFVRPMLRENNRIVVTHGDLHPRNILAINDEARGGIRITGLIDWEVGGAYPEYWEFVKSLNTVRPIHLGDWPFFLPLKGMGKYYGEYAIDCLIDNCVA